jgi:hypothetical protein
MASDRDETEDAGTDGHPNNSLLSQARAQHYRHYAGEIRGLAEARPPGSIRDQLTVLARQYEALAGMVARSRGDRAASSLPTRKRRVPKRRRTAAAALP